MPVDPAFWLDRWSTGHTPWHQPTRNARRCQHLEALDTVPAGIWTAR